MEEKIEGEAIPTAMIEFSSKDALYKVGDDGILVIGLGANRYSVKTRKVMRRFVKRLKLDPKELLTKDAQTVTKEICDAAARIDKSFVAIVQGDTILKISVKREVKQNVSTEKED
jgi:hypothetical protein